jgi:ribonuclease HI
MSNSYKQASFFRKPVKQHLPFDMSLVASGIHIFCDGACEPNPGAGGWGYVVYKDGREIADGSDGLTETTNNVMELSGMLKAIEWVKHSFMKDDAVTIWCDSKYVVDGCNDWRHKWKSRGWRRGGPNGKPESNVIMNLDLWKAIDEQLIKCPGIIISWVKGHNATLGNDRADELSLLGRKQAMEAEGLADPSVDTLDAEYRNIMAE